MKRAVASFQRRPMVSTYLSLVESFPTDLRTSSKRLFGSVTSWARSVFTARFKPVILHLQLTANDVERGRVILGPPALPHVDHGGSFGQRPRNISEMWDVDRTKR